MSQRCLVMKFRTPENSNWQSKEDFHRRVRCGENGIKYPRRLNWRGEPARMAQTRRVGEHNQGAYRLKRRGFRPTLMGTSRLPFASPRRFRLPRTRKFFGPGILHISRPAK